MTINCPKCGSPNTTLSPPNPLPGKSALGKIIRKVSSFWDKMMKPGPKTGRYQLTCEDCGFKTTVLFN
ncbi:MAG: hypothetical protein LBP92_14660 [Deltaproteobacteria bacterium]|nr:hypothetical protein [Deltaproteobacteria bacterium]